MYTIVFINREFYLLELSQKKEKRDFGRTRLFFASSGMKSCGWPVKVGVRYFRELKADNSHWKVLNYCRKTANHYGIHYTSSFAGIGAAPNLYSSCTTNGACIQQVHEDYRPIYFYVAQPYTIPYTFAKRPRASSLQKLEQKVAKSNCRVKFSKKLCNADFSQKVKQGEFSKSLNQVHFTEAQDKGIL